MTTYPEDLIQRGTYTVIFTIKGTGPLPGSHRLEVELTQGLDFAGLTDPTLRPAWYVSNIEVALDKGWLTENAGRHSPLGGPQ